MRGPFGVLVALLLAGVPTAVPAGAAVPGPAPWDAARSGALAACPATVELYDTEGRPLARPLAQGTRLLVYIRAGQPNVLFLGAHDLNRTAELVLSTPATDTSPLLINVDTSLLNDRFTWFVPQVRSVVGPPGELMWHFPTAQRVLLLGPRPPGLIFAPRADVRIAPSPPPSPSPTPVTPSPTPSPSAATPPPGSGTAPGAPGGLPPGWTPARLTPPRPEAARVTTRSGVRAHAVSAAGRTAARFPAARFPVDLTCGPSPSAVPSPSPSPSAGPIVAPPIAGTTAPAASRSPATVSAHLAALASRPVTWFGVALLLAGLALLVWITAGRRAFRRNW